MNRDRAPHQAALNRRTAVRLLGGAAAAAALSAGRRAGAAPLPVTDALGRNVVVDAPAQRIIPMFNYEEFTAVAGPAGWDRVVGYSKTVWADWRRSIWERYVAAVPRIGAIPDVGYNEDGTFSVERVIALRPQAVLMPQWAFAALTTAVEQLATLGIPVVVIDYNAQTVERHVASTLAMGAVMGAEARARELTELYQREVADIRRRVAAAGGPRPKVYFELGDQGPQAVGNTYTTTMWGRLLDLVGADNIATGRIPGALGQLNPEMVLAADPDFIFIGGSSWPGQPRSVRLGYEVEEASARASLAPYVERPAWRNLKAVRNGNVYAIQHGLARTLFDYTAAQYIAKALYPAQFADVDPIGSLRAYHERYLPVAFGGVWMLQLAS
jgi:ABC-type Fe3+-hydroxamate transport system substrate-binding protein